MARTKARARKGPEGHEYRQNMMTEAGRLKNKENKKRKHEEREASGLPKSDSSQTQPSKKAKTKPSTATSISQTSRPTTMSNSASSTDLVNISSPISDLEIRHEVTTMSILSSAHVQQKVTRVLEKLATFPHVPPAKPCVVTLHSKASVASKMITVAEIAKREIAKQGGKWFQYCRVESIMDQKKEGQNEAKMKVMKATKDEENSMDVPEADEPESEEETEAFETMKTPFERAIEGRPKLRAVPVMTLYLARIRIDSLRKLYGEQTNAVELVER